MSVPGSATGSPGKQPVHSTAAPAFGSSSCSWAVAPPPPRQGLDMPTQNQGTVEKSSCKGCTVQEHLTYTSEAGMPVLVVSLDLEN